MERRPLDQVKVPGPLKVLFFTLGDETVASSRTRVFQFLPHLREQGVSCELIQFKTGLDYRLLARSPKGPLYSFLLPILLKGVSLFHLAYSTVQTIRLILEARSVDVVFIQKVLLPPSVQALLQKVNTCIVFDYDDALYADERAYSKSLLEKQLRLSKLAVLENENTEAFARQWDVPVLRITGPIDCSRYSPRQERPRNDEVVVGWVGSGSTTPYLLLAKDALQTIAQSRPGWVLELIGAGPIAIPGVTIRSRPWSLATEVEGLRRFDIGLMPLPDNAFTRGKGGYKILQYMAMGIPCVASPVGVNSELLVDGKTGFLCQDTASWVGALTRLMKDSDLRVRMGQMARRRAEELYSYEVSTPKLLSGLRTVIEDHR